MHDQHSRLSDQNMNILTTSFVRLILVRDQIQWREWHGELRATTDSSPAQYSYTINTFKPAGAKKKSTILTDIFSNDQKSVPEKRF